MKLKHFIQRGIRGWSDDDIWDFDRYLISVISPALRRLAEKNISHPSKLTETEWKRILNKIADGLEAPGKEEEKYLHEEVNLKKQAILDEKAYKRQDEAIKLLAKYFLELWA